MLLQIWVLRPVDDSSSDASDLAVQSSIAPPGSRTFLECCPPDLTLDQLCARLGARHDRIYPDKAPLVIKKLQDCYKLDLDLDYRVGDVFKDRDSATPQSSVVRVIQSLATRESSLPLESALRPQRKRLRSPSTTIAHNEWGVPIKREPGLVLESQYGGRKASKRQRLQEISRSPSPDISLQLFEKEAQEEPAGHATIRSREDDGGFVIHAANGPFRVPSPQRGDERSRVEPEPVSRLDYQRLRSPSLSPLLVPDSPVLGASAPIRPEPRPPTGPNTGRRQVARSASIQSIEVAESVPQHSVDKNIRRSKRLAAKPQRQGQFKSPPPALLAHDKPGTGNTRTRANARDAEPPIPSQEIVTLVEANQSFTPSGSPWPVDRMDVDAVNPQPLSNGRPNHAHPALGRIGKTFPLPEQAKNMNLDDCEPAWQPANIAVASVMSSNQNLPAPKTANDIPAPDAIAREGTKTVGGVIPEEVEASWRHATAQITPIPKPGTQKGPTESTKTGAATKAKIGKALEDEAEPKPASSQHAEEKGQKAVPKRMERPKAGTAELMAEAAVVDSDARVLHHTENNENKTRKGLKGAANVVEADNADKTAKPVHDTSVRLETAATESKPQPANDDLDEQAALEAAKMQLKVESERISKEWEEKQAARSTRDEIIARTNAVTSRRAEKNRVSAASTLQNGNAKADIQSPKGPASAQKRPKRDVSIGAQCLPSASKRTASFVGEETSSTEKPVTEVAEASTAHASTQALPRESSQAPPRPATPPKRKRKRTASFVGEETSSAEKPVPEVAEASTAPPPATPQQRKRRVPPSASDSLAPPGRVSNEQSHVPLKVTPVYPPGMGPEDLETAMAAPVNLGSQETPAPTAGRKSAAKMAQKKWEISRPAPERESAVGQRPPAAAAPTAEEIVISSDEEQSVASYYSSGSITGRRAPEKLAQRTQPSARSGDDANVEPQQPVIESLSPAAVGEGDAPASPQKMNGQDPLQSQAFPLAVPNPTSTSSDRSSTRSPARYLSRTPSDSEPVGSPERPASPSSPSTSSTESEGSTSSDEDESDSDQPETDDAPKTSAAKDPEKIQTLSQEGGLARPSQEDNKRVVNDYDLQQHARQSVRLSSQHSAPANDRDRAEPDGKGPSPARLGGGMSVEHGPAEDGTPRKSHTKNGRAAPSATKTKLLSSQLSAQLEATVRERPGSQLKFPTMNPVRVEVSDDSDSDSDESSDDDDDDEEEEEEDESGGEQKTARPPSSVLRSTNATKNISALRSPRPPPATASPLPTSSSSKKRGGKGIVASRYAGLLSNLWPHKDSQG